MKYFKLLDKINHCEVIKQNSIDSEYQYCFGEEKWVRSLIMYNYRMVDKNEYGQFEEITEEEAFDLLNLKRKQYNDLLDLAYKIATKAHQGQVDKGGKPYIYHPRTLADSLTNIEYKIVAYLHDVCEDTAITFDDLLDMGFTLRIVNSIILLTKTKNNTYQEYLRRLSMNDCARVVKILDIKHNMDLSRISNPGKNDFERIEKYKKSLEILENHNKTEEKNGE